MLTISDIERVMHYETSPNFQFGFYINEVKNKIKVLAICSLEMLRLKSTCLARHQTVQKLINSELYELSIMLKIS